MSKRGAWPTLSDAPDNTPSQKRGKYVASAPWQRVAEPPRTGIARSAPGHYSWFRVGSDSWFRVGSGPRLLSFSREAVRGAKPVRGARPARQPRSASSHPAAGPRPRVVPHLILRHGSMAALRSMQNGLRLVWREGKTIPRTAGRADFCAATVGARPRTPSDRASRKCSEDRGSQRSDEFYCKKTKGWGNLTKG